MDKQTEGFKYIVKQTATGVHEFLYSISLSEQDRPVLIAGILIALEFDDFRNSYRALSRPDTFMTNFKQAIESTINDYEGLTSKKDKIIACFDFIPLNENLAKVEDGDIVLQELVKTIEDTVYTIAKKYPSYDIIGEFYSEFSKYSNSDQQSLGIVVTPHHMAEFMASLLDIQDDDVLLDICCGTGSLLLTGEASNGVGDNTVLGVELNSRMMALCAANMIIKGNDSHLWLGSSLDEDIQEKVKEYKPTKMILNPPYSLDNTPELLFVKEGLDMLEPGGRAAVIVPMSCAIKADAASKQYRKDILSKHKLIATFSMPDQLFYPVGVVTIVMVFEAYAKNDSDTFFGYLKDDGFEITRTAGRMDTKEKWFDIRSDMLKLYEDREAVAGKSALAKVDEKSEWCCEAYMETNLSLISSIDFINVARTYAMHKLIDGEE